MKVPRYEQSVNINTPQVATPRQPQAVPGAFTDTKAQGLQDTGDTIMKLANLMQDRAVERKAIENSAYNSQLSTQFRLDQQNRLLNDDGDDIGFLNRKLDQAKGVVEEYDQYSLGKIDEHVSQVKDPEYQAKLAQSLQSDYLSTRNQIIKHQRDEEQKYFESSFDGNKKSLIDSAYLAQDPGALTAKINEVTLIQSDYNKAIGVDEKTGDLNIQGAVKDVVEKAVMGSLQADNTGTAAEALLASAKDKLSKENYDELKTNIKDIVTKKTKENERVLKVSQALEVEKVTGLTIDGKLTLDKLSEFRGKIPEKDYLANKKALLNTKTADPLTQAIVYNNLQDRLLSMQDNAGNFDVSLEDIAEYRYDVLKAVGEGKLTASKGQTFLQKVSIGFDDKDKEKVKEQLNWWQRITGMIDDTKIKDMTEQEKAKMTQEIYRRLDSGANPEEVAKDMLIQSISEDDPTLGIADDEILKNYQEKQERESSERMQEDLSFDWNKLNPFGATEAEAADMVMAKETADSLYESLPEPAKHLAGAIGNKIMDIVSGGMSLTEADEFQRAFAESAMGIPADIFSVSSMLFGMVKDDIGSMEAFLQNPIKSMNRLLQGKRDEEMKDQVLKYANGRDATLNVLGRILRPLGRVINVPRALIGTGIDQSINTFKTGELDVGQNVAEMLQSGMKGFLKPEEIDTIISRIPFLEWEREGSTKAGSVIRLAPRAVAEAIETYVLAEWTLGLPSKLNKVKKVYAEKDITKTFENIRNNPQMREDFRDWIASRGGFNATAIGDDLEGLTDNIINAAEINFRNNPRLVKEVIKNQTFGKILQEKLSSEVGTLKFVPEVAPFKSNLQAVAQYKMPGVVTAEQALATFRNAGVAKEEIEAIEDAIKGKGKMTRDELVDIVDKNKVKVEPIVKGQRTEEETKRLQEIYKMRNKMDWNDRPLEERKILDKEAEMLEKKAISTKYSQYTLPGGENYQETLLTVPGNEYVDPHYQQKGTVVEHRTTQRQDSQANKGTLVEEIQSDLHREGKSKGYGNKEQDYINSLKSKEAKDIAKQMLNAPANSLTSGEFDKEWERLAELEPDIDHNAIHDINRYGATSGVPNAPFKNTWHELALKDIIRQAVERGDKFVAFISGEQTADRYKLSKQVKEIKWVEEMNGRRTVKMYPIGQIHFELDISTKGDVLAVSSNAPTNWIGKKLEDVIGKGISSRVMGENKGKIEGENLDIGGEWAKKFYDEILPRAAGKYVKKWGAKIEDIKIPIQRLISDIKFEKQYDNNWYSQDEIINIQESKIDGKFRVYDYVQMPPKQIGITDNFQKAQNIAIQHINKIKSQEATQKGFYITPQMAKEVKEVGQPLFGNRLEGTLLQKLQSEKGMAEPEGSEPVPDDWEGEPAIFQELQSNPKGGEGDHLIEEAKKYKSAEEFENIPIIKYAKERLADKKNKLKVDERNIIAEKMVDEGIMSIEDFNSMTEQHGFGGKVTGVKNITTGKPIPSKPVEGNMGEILNYISQWQTFRNAIEFGHRNMIIRDLNEGKNVPKDILVHYIGWTDGSGRDRQTEWAEDALRRLYPGENTEKLISKGKELNTISGDLFKESNPLGMAKRLLIEKEGVKNIQEFTNKINEWLDSEGKDVQDDANKSFARQMVKFAKENNLTTEEFFKMAKGDISETKTIKELRDKKEKIKKEIKQLTSIWNKAHPKGGEVEAKPEEPLFKKEDSEQVKLLEFDKLVKGEGFTMVPSSREMSTFIKNLPQNVSKREALKQFEKTFKQLSKEPAKTVAKKTIRKATGQVKGGGKSISEPQALKRSLKRQEQAARKGALEKKKEVKEIHKSIEKIKKLPIEGMGYEERGKIEALKKELKTTRTVDGLRSLLDKVVQLKEEGKAKYIATKQLKDEQFALDKEILLQTRKVSPAKQQPKVRATKQSGEKGKIAKTALATTLRPTRIFDALDGGQNFEGPHNQFFYNRVNRATNESMQMTQERRDKFTNYLAENNISLSDLAQTRTIDGTTYTVSETIGVYNALKNPEKTKAMVFGNKIPLETAQKIVAQMTDAEKAIGDYIVGDYDGNWERLRKAFIDYTDGKQDLGKVRGYSPIRRLSETYEPTQEEIANELVERNNLSKTYAERGFTKERVKIGEAHQAPVMMDEVGLFFDQIDKVEHFISHGSLIKELQRMLSDKDFARSIIDDPKFGKPYYDALKHWVNRIANHDIYKSYLQLERLAPVLRRNASTAYLTYNLVTIGKQFPSLGLFLGETTLPRLLAGMGEMSFNNAEAVDLMHRMSPQMKDRAIEREMEEFKKAHYGQYQKIIQTIGEAGYRGIFEMDHYVVGCGWHAVYNQSLDAGFSPEESAELAEKAVFRTQPAAHAKDIAELYATSEFLNWFTQFSNQLNNIYNVVTYDIPMRAKSGDTSGAMRGFLGVVLSQMLIYMIAKGRLIDMKDAGDFVAESTLNLIPLVGRMLNSQRKGFDAFSTPALASVKSAGQSMTYAYKSIKKPSKRQRITQSEYLMRALEKLAETAALIYGIPFAQPKKTLKGAKRLLTGETKDPRELIWSPYTINENKKTKKKIY